MATRFPGQHVFFASWNKPKDIKTLSDLLVSMSSFASSIFHRYGFLIRSLCSGVAKRNPYAVEMNVLVIGMPNVGKSTLLNALRNMGISGRTLFICFSQSSTATTQFECGQEHQKLCARLLTQAT